MLKTSLDLQQHGILHSSGQSRQESTAGLMWRHYLCMPCRPVRTKTKHMIINIGTTNKHTRHKKSDPRVCTDMITKQIQIIWIFSTEWVRTISHFDYFIYYKHTSQSWSAHGVKVPTERGFNCSIFTVIPHSIVPLNYLLCTLIIRAHILLIVFLRVVQFGLWVFTFLWI